MVHINDEGELLELRGSLLEIGADISSLITTVVMSLKEEGEGEKYITEFIAATLKTVIGAVEGKDVKEAVRDGCRVVTEYGEMDDRFMIYKKNGSLTGYKS